MLITFSAFSQKKLTTIETPAKVAYASVDRPGDVYVVLETGDVLKYDKDGKQIGKRSFKTVSTIFDARDGIRAFAYFRETQTVESIAPDLSFTDTSPLHPEFAVSAWMVCPSKNELWLLDSADVTLKKTKNRATSIAYEADFRKGENDVRKIVFMREYQNFLFVLDKESGIHVLNNLGKEIKRIDAKGVSWFNFIGEELYYPKGNSIELVDLYTAEKRELQLPHPSDFVLLTDERMILVKGKTVEFFEFKP